MSLFFSIKEALRSMARARLATVLSLSSITLTLILMGGYLTLSLNLNQWIGSLREKVELEIFIEAGSTSQQIAEVRKQLNEFNEIETINFIDKKTAAQRFQDEFGQNIYDVLDYNPLPESFRVKLKPEFRNASAASSLSNKIGRISAVDEIVYQKFLLATLDEYIGFAIMIAFLVGLFIILISVALIYNTIRLTIYARRDAIYIMRLVGATEAFIRRPFLVEGLLQGGVACALASAALYYLLKLVRVLFYPFLAFDDRIYLVLLVFALLIGLLSAGLSVRKYLRVIY